MLYFYQDFVTPKKQPQSVTHFKHGKRGVVHGSSESSSVKYLAEGEQSSIRLRRKHVMMEKK